MTKELDTFSYAFMVELVDCPKKNAFPCRKGKPEMFRFAGGYYSFDEDFKLMVYHRYSGSLYRYNPFPAQTRQVKKGFSIFW